jgi:hypothetical protein
MGFIERPYCERLGTPFVSDDGDATVSPAAIADPPAYDRGPRHASGMLRAISCIS